MKRDGSSNRQRARNESGGSPSCDHCPVRGLAFCSTLDPRSQATLRQMSSRVPMTTGEILAEEGQRNTPFQVVVKGVVELSKDLPHGRRQVMGFRFPGELISVPSPDTGNRISAHAITPGTVCRIDIGAFWHLARAQSEIGRRLLAVACEEIAAAQDQILLLRRKSAAERVAHFIAHLPCYGQHKENVVEMVMKRQDMADYLGLTTETVSRALATLRDEGIVHLADRRHAVIDDPAGLAERAHGKSREGVTVSEGSGGGIPN